MLRTKITDQSADKADGRAGRRTPRLGASSPSDCIIITPRASRRSEPFRCLRKPGRLDAVRPGQRVGGWCPGAESIARLSDWKSIIFPMATFQWTRRLLAHHSPKDAGTLAILGQWAKLHSSGVPTW